MAKTARLATPLGPLGDVAQQARRLLRWSRRRAAPWTALLDAEVDGSALRARRLQLGFSTPVFSARIWAGWVDVDLGEGLATRGAEGTYSREQLDRTPALRPALVALGLADLLELPALLRAVDALVPAAHRRSLLELQLGLANEAGAPRWRLQYEASAHGVRVVHLDARTAAVLHDHFVRVGFKGSGPAADPGS